LNTLGTLLLALQVQEGGASVPGSTSVLDLVQRTGPVNQTVLALLAILSIISWAIILHKSWAYRSAGRHTRTFLDVFHKSSKFSEVQAVCPGLGESPLVGLFQSGYAELNAQLRSAPAGDPQRPAAAATRPTLKSLDSVDRALLRATTVELSKLESRVTFLATTASLTPFIGLFGTVWGIMSSFLSISAVGSSSLQTVGPGIAEALIATAAGLFAAIPAVFFYNHFTNRVKHFSNEMDDFALEFLNISERNFT